MKVPYKAALLSAFVFPGAGQFYLKKYWRALIIMVPAAIGLCYIIWSETLAALSILDGAIVKWDTGAANLQELSNVAGSKMLTTDPYHGAVFYLIVCFWIFSIIDAYIIGKEKEAQNGKTSQF